MRKLRAGAGSGRGGEGAARCEALCAVWPTSVLQELQGSCGIQTAADSLLGGRALGRAGGGDE
jgi:hypothetical protein